MSRYMNYDIRHINGHVEVFRHGQFVLSADTVGEAIRELRMREE